MNARDEYNELLRQAIEHLRYYREIGVPDIGEAVRPELTLQAAARFEEAAPEAMMISPPQPPPPAAPDPTPVMPAKKDPAVSLDVPSLFGDAAPAIVEPIPSNETLEQIRADLGDCQRCKLWTTRTKLVFGEGSPDADLMFVGEGPGADEDASGRPFVGRAGQLLTKMIEAIEFKREQVYIANVVKSRPPGNRAPESDEVRACIPFLFRQIASVKPKLIVALGNPAMQALLETKLGITKMRGQFQDYPRDASIKVMPTFHPAYLLRSPDKKREAWEDLKKVRAFLRGEISE